MTESKLHLCKDQHGPDLEQTAAAQRQMTAQNLEGFSNRDVCVEVILDCQCVSTSRAPMGRLFRPLLCSPTSFTFTRFHFVSEWLENQIVIKL